MHLITCLIKAYSLNDLIISAVAVDKIHKTKQKFFCFNAYLEDKGNIFNTYFEEILINIFYLYKIEIRKITYLGSDIYLFFPMLQHRLIN